MFVKAEVKVQDWSRWHAEVLSALASFMADSRLVPNLIVTNEATSERIRVAMEEGDSPESLLHELAWAAVAAMDALHALDFCIRADLPDDVMAIVYDDEAEVS